MMVSNDELRLEVLGDNWIENLRYKDDKELIRLIDELQTATRKDEREVIHNLLLVILSVRLYLWADILKNRAIIEAIYAADKILITKSLNIIPKKRS